MQQMHKTWAQKGWAAAGGRRPPFWGAAEGGPPSFVHLLHCFYMLFACFAFFTFYLHFVCIAAGDDEAAAAAVADCTI